MNTYPRPRRKRVDMRSLRTVDPARFLRQPASVVSVTGTNSDPITVWTFDQPVIIEAGATWQMFNLHLADGSETRIGIAGNQTGPNTIEVELLFAPEDIGQPWNWQISFTPPKIKTVDGAGVNVREGVARVEG